MEPDQQFNITLIIRDPETVSGKGVSERFASVLLPPAIGYAESIGFRVVMFFRRAYQ